MLGQPNRRLRLRLPARLLFLFSILGPGIIAANADNDASGIYGYSLAGAQYRYGLLWVLILVTISLGVCQEMGARLGSVTGKGLADLIREEYGMKITVFAMLVLVIANFATTVSEFAGIAAAISIFAPSWARWIIIPLTALGIWALMTRGSYKRVERILLLASLIYLLYIVSTFLAKPHWSDVLRQTVAPTGVRFDSAYLFVVINVIGTTITPWGQFYIQSSIRDKGLRADHYRLTRIDVLFGAFFTNFIAYFIIVCCGTTLFHNGITADQVANQFSDAGQIAVALKPIAGALASVLFAIGLFNASCFGAITVPISTAYAISESLGSESGVGRRAREAPLFVGVFTFLIFAGALTVLLSSSKYLAFLILLPNVVGAALLPIILILTLRLVNNKELMGEFTNSRIYNAIAWATTIVLIVLSAILVLSNGKALLTGNA